MRRGFTLVEVSVASLVVAILGVTTVALMTTTGKQIRRTDARSEDRHLVREVLDRVEALDFLSLYQNFGIEPESVGRMKEGLYRPSFELDGERVPEYDPLGLPQRLKDAMLANEWTTRLTFRFLTREELGVDPGNGATSLTGVLHLQAGEITLAIERPGHPPVTIRKSLFCPLVLGRPGLVMSQCPATNQGLKDGLLKDVP